jgi:drug/metabolite transporter (DMT)-like permease
MSKKFKGILFITIATLAYSFMPILVRVLDAGKIPPKTQVFSRYLFAFACALTYFILSKQKFKTKGFSWSILILMGIFGYGITNVFFTYSMILTTIANALFLFNIFGILTPVLSFFLRKEKLSKYDVLSLVVSFVSLYFLFQPSGFDTWKIGGIIALAGALLQSLYLVGRKAISNVSSAQILLVSTFLGLLTVGMLSFTTEFEFYKTGIDALTVSNILVIGIFGVLNFVGWFFMSKGFEYLNSTTASMILLSENVIAALFALAVFAEAPTIATIFGGILMIAASLVSIIKAK